MYRRTKKATLLLNVLFLFFISYLFFYKPALAQTYVLQAELTASDIADLDNFGAAVAISGDTVVVGDPLKDKNGESNLGAAYIYERNQGGINQWGEVKQLDAGDGISAGEFGGSVAIAGDLVVVGAHTDDDKGFRSGSVYIFERNLDGANNWGLVKKLIAGDGSQDEEFGDSVAITDNTVVVGAVSGKVNAFFRGTAYIYERDQGGADNWGEVKKLIASDADNVAQFGDSVAIFNDTIVVGASSDNHDSPATLFGAAYIYERNQGGSNNWGEAKKLIASDPAGFDNFGGSVAISSDTVIVGVSNDDDKGFDSGSAFIYERNQGGTNNWGEVKKLTASDGSTLATFGMSVAIAGDKALIGASGGTGSAYLYERNQGGADNWGEIQKLTAVDNPNDIDFGAAVAINGNTLLVGEPGDEDITFSHPGAANIFEPPNLIFEDHFESNPSAR